jgi:hypothetical protein
MTHVPSRGVFLSLAGGQKFKIFVNVTYRNREYSEIQNIRERYCNREYFKIKNIRELYSP